MVQKAYARITPEDIVNSQKDVYNKIVSSYSPSDKQKLEKLSGEIALINKQRTDQLEQICLVQGEILDEYLSRNGNKSSSATDKARYWITYAHEAVAYQAAKIYIYNLTSESNLKPDALNLISNFQSDLDSARAKVSNSQNILQEVIK